MRTKKAVSDKQEADLALKKAEKEIENLERTLEKQKEKTQKTFESTIELDQDVRYMMQRIESA
ncbi:MAG: hypothetical protein J7K81_05945 [Methanophagales archaeon]|nr:hypothetical protein [Methanophagales archaeon]